MSHKSSIEGIRDPRVLQPLTAEEALTLIHAFLDGNEWNADTLDSIAGVVTAAGFRFGIRPPRSDASD